MLFYFLNGSRGKFFFSRQPLFYREEKNLKKYVLRECIFGTGF